MGGGELRGPDLSLHGKGFFLHRRGRRSPRIVVLSLWKRGSPLCRRIPQLEEDRRYYSSRIFQELIHSGKEIVSLNAWPHMLSELTGSPGRLLVGQGNTGKFLLEEYYVYLL